MSAFLVCFSHFGIFMDVSLHNQLADQYCWSPYQSHLHLSYSSSMTLEHKLRFEDLWCILKEVLDFTHWWKFMLLVIRLCWFIFRTIRVVFIITLDQNYLCECKRLVVQIWFSRWVCKFHFVDLLDGVDRCRVVFEGFLFMLEAAFVITHSLFKDLSIAVIKVRFGSV